MEIVLCLGFDLFFKPKIADAARAASVEVRYAAPQDAVAKSDGIARVVADVSAPGVEDALRALRAARHDLPILACYPHVETGRADAVRAMGGVAVTRGRFAEHLREALAGKLA